MIAESLLKGTALPSKRENAIGVLYLFVTAACWSFVAVVVKQLTGTVDSNTISFLSCLSGHPRLRCTLCLAFDVQSKVGICAWQTAEFSPWYSRCIC
jgi:drug/metabolite transporter (DMT)-like permease